MADYALHRMRLHQENKLAPVSSKQDADRSLAFYKQALDINTRLVAELLLRDDAQRMSPSMQQYYWETVADLANKSNR